jgi:Glycine zipper 2TM domain
MEQLGFNVAQVLVTEWLTSALEGALVFGAGGGVLGSATKDPWLMAAGALLGALAGAAAGSLMRTAKARLDAQLLHPFGGGWRITPQVPPQSAAGAWGPAPYGS